MKRGIILSLCLATVAAFAAPAQAQTEELAVALNLTYTDPANAGAGGTWELVAKTSTSLGVSAIHAIIDNLDNGSGDITITSGNGAIDPVQTSGGPVQAVLTSGTLSSILFGQDLSNTSGNPAQVSGVGRDGAASDQDGDQFFNSAWDDASLIASGSFSGSRPAFATSGGSSSDGNVYTVFAATGDTSRAVAAASTAFVVRGDSLNTLNIESADGSKGLLAGDANRDGVVNVADLGALATNWQGTGKAWADGNFSGSQNDTDVNVADLGALATNFGSSQTPVAVSAVPEPTSLALLALAGLAVGGLRRREV